MSIHTHTPEPNELGTCTLCDQPATHTVSAPADTGPFTAVEESREFAPRDRWDMPVCAAHVIEMDTVVECANCHRQLPTFDAIHNSTGTVSLCRPCNASQG